MSFKSIIGHKEVIKALESSLDSQKLGHAFLFVGPEHVGKETLARCFAEKLLCNGNPLIENCDCDSCRRFSLDNHPDFITISPNGNSIKIDQLRELQRKAHFSPVVGKYKIFFFPEAEKLTDAAANSFLKLLEEAPAGIKFLFTAIRSDYILPTIRSRCQVYTLFPASIQEIAAFLEESGISPEEACRIAEDSGGLPGLALTGTKELSENNIVPWNEVISEDLLRLFKMAEELEKKERREVLAVLREWEKQLRRQLIEIQDLTFGNSQKLSQLINILEKLAQVIVMCESNVHVRLLLEEFFITVKLKTSIS